MPIQENQGVQRLILCRRADVPSFREVSQELPHLRIAHFGGMPFVMENHETPDPTYIGFFGSWAVVPKPDGASSSVQELGLSWLNGRTFAFHEPNLATAGAILCNGLKALESHEEFSWETADF